MPKLEYAYEDPSGSFVVGQTPYGTYDNDSRIVATLGETTTKFAPPRRVNL